MAVEKSKQKVYTFGLQSLKFGDIPADGGMASEENLHTIGYTEQDSCTFTQEDAEETEIFAEENDSPVITITKDGKFTLEATIMNPSPEILVDMCGGRITENGGWGAPALTPDIEKCVKITPRQGFSIFCPRVKIRTTFNSEMKKNVLGWKLVVKGTVLVPEKTGLDKVWVEVEEKAVATTTSVKVTE